MHRCLAYVYVSRDCMQHYAKKVMLPKVLHPGVGGRSHLVKKNSDRNCTCHGYCILCDPGFGIGVHDQSWYWQRDPGSDQQRQQRGHNYSEPGHVQRERDYDNRKEPHASGRLTVTAPRILSLTARALRPGSSRLRIHRL